MHQPNMHFSFKIAKSFYHYKNQKSIQFSNSALNRSLNGQNNIAASALHRKLFRLTFTHSNDIMYDCQSIIDDGSHSQ